MSPLASGRVAPGPHAGQWGYETPLPLEDYETPLPLEDYETPRDGAESERTFCDSDDERGHKAPLVQVALMLPPKVRTVLFKAIDWPSVLYLRHVLPHLRHDSQYWNRLDRYVLLGGQPFKADVAELQGCNVGAVVNLCADVSGPLKEYVLHGMDHFHLPCPSSCPPTLDQINESIRLIIGYAQTGKTVYLHSKSGNGRAATTALCWIMYTRQFSPEDALLYIMHIRPQVKSYLAHRKVVHDFANQGMGATITPNY